MQRRSAGQLHRAIHRKQIRESPRHGSIVGFALKIPIAGSMLASRWPQSELLVTRQCTAIFGLASLIVWSTANPSASNRRAPPR